MNVYWVSISNDVGNWQFGASVHLPEDIDMESLEQDSDVYVVVDEDADFDESASSAIESDASNASVASYRAECIRREARMLVAMAKYLIPHVGDGVETIILSNSKGVTNGLVCQFALDSIIFIDYHCSWFVGVA